MSFRLKAILLAMAIGAGTVAAATLATTIPFGLPFLLGTAWWALSQFMLVVALPFLVLALLAERSGALWASALALTVLLWGWYVYEAVTYRLHGSSVLAHAGFDVILFFYPFPLAFILAGVSGFRRHILLVGVDADEPADA